MMTSKQSVESIRATLEDMRANGLTGGLPQEHAFTLLEEITRLRQWVADLQSGMYINCVYCGHRYGPGETTPMSMADALKAHVERCPEHPMAKLRASLVACLEFIEPYNDVQDAIVEEARKLVGEQPDPAPYCQYCGARRRADCHCGPIAENH